MKKIIFVLLIGFMLVGLTFAQSGTNTVRTGEINRGIFFQEGIASWYGGEFNGRPTASGEIFNDTQLTAAHPFLPFGTMVRVTNQHNNRSVTVRINDRGPFVAARVIDLSRTAAQQLDMIITGTAPVTIESIDEVSLAIRPGETVQLRSASIEPISVIEAGQNPIPSRPQAPVQTAPAGLINDVRFRPGIPTLPTDKNYIVQVGAFRQPQNAVDTFERLKNAGFNPSYERHQEYVRVILPGLKHEELVRVSEWLGNAGFNEVLLREEH